jgi:hypothetical protein
VTEPGKGGSRWQFKEGFASFFSLLPLFYLKFFFPLTVSFLAIEYIKEKNGRQAQAGR